MHLKKIPEQFWLLVLVSSWYYLPLSSIFNLDTKAKWVVVVLCMQWLLVISCYILSRSRWCAAIIIIEVFCMAYNVAACYAPDALRDSIYNSRPLIVWLAFILQLTAIAISTGGGVGSHDNYNRRKSDPSDNSDSDLNCAQPLLGGARMVEAQK